MALAAGVEAVGGVERETEEDEEEEKEEEEILIWRRAGCLSSEFAKRFREKARPKMKKFAASSAT